jgi:V8-like Glu-specific endopeptidase
VRLRAAIVATAAFGAITVLAAPAVAAPAVGAAVAGQTTAPAGAAGCLRVQTLTFTRAQDVAALHHWTPARMKAAKGFSRAALRKLARSQRPPTAARPASATQCVPAAGLSRAVAATAPRPVTSTTASSGYPTVGKFTFDADGVLSLNCTATVISGTAATNNQELIVTAAHCIEGTTGGIPYTSTDLAFSPMWHDNKAPYGTWTVKKVFLNGGWMKCTIPLVDCSTNPLDDYAVIVLNPQNGKGVGDITGADGWSVNQPDAVSNVTIAGIPGNSSDTLTSVANTATVIESGNLYRKAATPGLTDGSSGGPWFQAFSTTTDRGVLLADTGGYEQGGPASGSPSYADYWTSNFSAVVKGAVSYEG